ncbi:MAG: deoxynucleoside kinase [Burkholderiales bacterium]|nr:deoxynucleoside kinase [Burkholderiales bacterium]
MPPGKYRYIAIDGPIGAGKTSLARKLAERLDGEPFLERPGENPFLPGFYEDMPRHALPTQLFFLFQRVGQLRELAQLRLFSGVTVADFLLEKDQVFAQLTLSGDELSLYRQIYAALKPQAPAPDLVIYLHAELETLYERMRKRAVDYEATLDREYLAALADAYARFFHHYAGAPLLVVNSERLNFVDKPADLELLVERIASMRAAREYFNVGG